MRNNITINNALENPTLQSMLNFLRQCKLNLHLNDNEAVFRPLASAFLLTEESAVNFYDAYWAWEEARGGQDKKNAWINAFRNENIKLMSEFAVSVVPWRVIPKMHEYFLQMDDWQRFYESFSMFRIEEIDRFSAFVYNASNTTYTNGIQVFLELGEVFKNPAVNRYIQQGAEAQVVNFR